MACNFKAFPAHLPAAAGLLCSVAKFRDAVILKGVRFLTSKGNPLINPMMVFTSLRAIQIIPDLRVLE